MSGEAGGSLPGGIAGSDGNGNLTAWVSGSALFYLQGCDSVFPINPLLPQLAVSPSQGQENQNPHPDRLHPAAALNRNVYVSLLGGTAGDANTARGGKEHCVEYNSALKDACGAASGREH